MDNSYSRVIDVGDRIDEGEWTPIQKMAAALAALAIILDGLDSQLLGYAIPTLMHEWNLPRGAFPPVIAIGLVGMALGSALIGPLADRMGRRRAIIVSVILIGCATTSIAFAHDMLTLGALRFVAGLGIGATLPSATTLAAEFTPFRHRVFAVTVTIVCVPLGGMLAGLLAAWVLPTHGWRFLFLAGGILPIIFSVLLILFLPESPRFLVRRPHRWPELRALCARMRWDLDAETRFLDGDEKDLTGNGRISDLFRVNSLQNTIGLSAAFFLCLFAVYSAFSWVPTMLATEGLSQAESSWGLTAYNIGGVAGSFLCARAITRFGSRMSLTFACLAAAASALALAVMGVTSMAVIIVGLGTHGLFVNGVQSTLYAVAAHAYSTRIRASGTALVLAIGRCGAMLSAFVGAFLISVGGSTAFLLALAAVTLAAAASLALIRDHIPGQGKVPD